ncbi:MAG: helix-hairpin-helix domain-containing protein [Candidatus Nitrosopolaris sp.]
MKIKNADVAKLFREMAFLLEMEDQSDSNVNFKVRSYKAATSDVLWQQLFVLLRSCYYHYFSPAIIWRGFNPILVKY